MALQVQASTTTTGHHSALGVNAGLGLRRNLNPLALKSSFFTGSINLYLHPNQRNVTSAPPRISMRVASKQAYICRDCGFPFTLFPLISIFQLLLCRFLEVYLLMYIDAWCRYIYNEKTPFDKLPDNFFCRGNWFSLLITNTKYLQCLASQTIFSLLLK